MKNYIKPIFIIILVLAYSCEDLIDTRPVSTLTPDIAFETGEDAEAAILGSYNRLLNALGGSNRFFLYGEMRADSFEEDLAGWQIYRENRLTPTTGLADWSPFYQLINHCNQLIEVLPDIKEISEIRRSQIKAEAHFLRAISYFWLVRIWRSIPLVENAYVSVNQELKLPQSPVSAVFELIEQDIVIAINDLPVSYSSNVETRGRATKGAAHALNAHFALWMAQRENGGAPYYEKAITSANYILNNNPLYELVGNFESIFRGNEDTQEYIFAMIYNIAWQQTNALRSAHLVAPLDPILRANTKFSQKIHDHIANNPDDIRTPVYYRLKRPEDLVQNPFFVKFLGKSLNDQGYSNSDSNIPLFRYADILLLKAEALNETGFTPDAIQLVNDVRDRANLGDVSAANQDDARDLILNERLIELIGEGHRFWDLVRTNKAVAELPFIASEDQILWPIHLNELTQNPNLIQNSAWGK